MYWNGPSNGLPLLELRAESGLNWCPSGRTGTISQSDSSWDGPGSSSDIPKPGAKSAEGIKGGPAKGSDGFGA